MLLDLAYYDLGLQKPTDPRSSSPTACKKNAKFGYKAEGHLRNYRLFIEGKYVNVFFFMGMLKSDMRSFHRPQMEKASRREPNEN